MPKGLRQGLGQELSLVCVDLGAQRGIPSSLVLGLPWDLQSGEHGELSPGRCCRWQFGGIGWFQMLHSKKQLCYFPLDPLPALAGEFILPQVTPRAAAPGSLHASAGGREQKGAPMAAGWQESWPVIISDSANSFPFAELRLSWATVQCVLCKRQGSETRAMRNKQPWRVRSPLPSLIWGLNSVLG